MCLSAAGTALVLALVLAAVGGASAKQHKYKRGDAVPVVASKIGPFANPTETYQYYDLP